MKKTLTPEQRATLRKENQRQQHARDRRKIVADIFREKLTQYEDGLISNFDLMLAITNQLCMRDTIDDAQEKFEKELGAEMELRYVLKPGQTPKQEAA